MSLETKKKKFPKWTIPLICVGGVAVVSLSVIGIYYLSTKSFAENYDPEISDKIEIETPDDGIYTITAKGRGLYDKDGNRVMLKGVNYGNWLIQEGWMTVNSIGIEYNEDGSYKKINNDGIIESYYEVCQNELEKALYINPNLTDSQVESLWDAYYDAYCQEQDFINIKELGLNMIRLPVWYRTFMEGPDDNLVMKDDAFERVDWFLEMAKKHDLYVILDMHGVPGGQNGYEHSGTFDCKFWDTPKYVEQTCSLWKEIARHYVEDRPDLAYTLASYDIVNEPVNYSIGNANTSKEEWAVFDKIYDAIREVDTKHVITIEGVWFMDNLPDPKKYGWENVMYEYHLYNWNLPTVTNDAFYTLMLGSLKKADYNVPKYIGEFTFFDDQNEWVKYLNMYDSMGFNWSFWSYKTISVGYWDTSWGLYVQKMNLFNEQKKLDVRTATYDEIYNVWSKESTAEKNTSTGILMKSIKAYFAQLED